MTFAPVPSGTYGTRQPGTMVRWVNKLTMKRIVRKGGGRMMGMDALVLTTVGRRSGEPRTSPVARFPEEGGTWLIVASANGAAKHPAWYHNLAAHPDRAAIEMDGHRTEVTAHQLEGAERDEAWQRITTAQPRFGQYATKTDREIPVIRLTPRSR
ncbi:nitroreductase/quinone reductase family protein [Streptomyces sp. NPDC005574]|uniref:nitroreductase/quinone reductase family protein n=1 Tax=Streptomyces sp. NPDC005574 TaxID=3156891 RepID=UPI0033B2AE97